MRAKMTTKKRIVWKNRPTGVGQPLALAIVPTNPPNIQWIILYVSGLATRKNTSAE